MRAAAAVVVLAALSVSAGSSEPAQAPSKGWRAIARLPAPLITKAIAELDGTLFFFSGAYAEGPTKAVTAYDLAARSWSERAPMPRSLYNQDAVALGGLIYTAGGCVRSDCSYPSGDAYAYDPKADSWSVLPSLPEPVFDAAGAAIDGRFVVVGGVARGAASRRVYAYAPDKRTWSRLSDLPAPRSHAAGAMFKGRYFLTGGCKSEAPGRYCDEISDGVFVYDPKTDAWSSGPSLTRPLHGHGAAVSGGKLILAGGICGAARVSDCGTYMIASGDKRWERGPNLLRARFGARLVPLADGLALFGPNATNNPEDIVEALWSSAPSIDPGAPPFPAAPRGVRPPEAKLFDAEDPESLPSAAAPRPRAHAVVIGVERYRQSLPRATFASNDANLTAEYFRRVLGVPEENLAVLKDDLATKSDFEKYFERWLPNRVDKGDEVYVYFSGHGAPDAKKGEAYLVPFDADPAYLEQTGYSLRELYAHLAKLPAQRVVVILDSCFSGAGGRSVIAEGARPLVSVVEVHIPRRIIVMSASAGNQISNSYREKGHGLFTYFFLKGLKEKRGDMRAAFDYLKPQVSRVARRQFNSDQEPQWRSGGR